MKRFNIVENGYNVDEVNRFIDIVIGRLEKLNAENETYKTRINELNTATKNNEVNVSNDNFNVKQLEKAILAVQDTTDRMRDVAKEEARVIIDEARNNANSIVHEALVKAERIERERAILERNVKVYKERMKSLVEGQLSLIDDLDKEEI